jgi:hypothetical protein
MKTLTAAERARGAAVPGITPPEPAKEAPPPQANDQASRKCSCCRKSGRSLTLAARSTSSCGTLGSKNY